MKLLEPPNDDPPSAPGSDLSLFPPEIIQALETAEAKHGQYTAERLKTRKPELYRAIITFRGLGWGQLAIARTLGVHHRTVAAVDRAEPEAIEKVQERMIGDLGRAIHLQLERLLEHPDLVPWSSIGLVLGTLIDKREVLSGRVSSRSETVESIDIYGDWKDFVEKQLAPANVTEIASRIGLPAEKSAAIKEEGAPDPDSLAVPIPDGESDVSEPITQGTGSDDPSIDPTLRPAADAPDHTEGSQIQTSGEGGGGDPEERGRSTGLIDSASRKFCGHEAEGST